MAGPTFRLRDRGPTALTNSELVAVIAGDKAAESLAVYGETVLGGALTAGPAALRALGVAPGAADRLIAASELGKRAKSTASVGVCVTGATQSAPLLAPLFYGMQREAFGVLFLTQRHIPIAAEILFTGGGTETPVYPGVVARRALLLSARAVVVAHNHPSGDLTPSREDEAVTRRLAAALATVEVRLLDHLIFHGDRWRSVEGVS